MEKLIKLLDEYQHRKTEDLEWGKERVKDNTFWIICKKFGFILWLVENNEIDNTKFYDKNILKGFIALTSEERADSIIMNLSVSDTPIEDLISYLK